MPGKIARILCCISWFVLSGGFRDRLAARQENTRSSRQDATSPEQDKTQREIAATVYRLVNEFRRKHGLKPLTLDPVISSRAREHSADMAQNDGISHRGFAERIKDIEKKIPYRAAAENVAVNLGYINPAGAAVEGWSKSPEHRKNMLGEFSLTGIGIAQGKDGRYFFTQIFVQPLK